MDAQIRQRHAGEVSGKLYRRFSLFVGVCGNSRSDCKIASLVEPLVKFKEVFPAGGNRKITQQELRAKDSNKCSQERSRSCIPLGEVLFDQGVCGETGNPCPEQEEEEIDG